MKIAFLADCHLGAGNNTEHESDSFDNLEEALEKSADCDLIVIAGDLFDTRSPRTGVWARAISLLSVPMLRKSTAKLVATNKNLNGVHARSLEAQPVVCLHGNHDRRMRDETNAVQALDAAGLLLHLHKETLAFEKDGVKVAIHGMSNVPERFASQALRDWNPRPVAGAHNVLVIHQNVAPYVYSPLEPPSISLEDLPRGFDMILDGHIHTKVIDKAGESLFMILGSTVTTQFDKKEAGSVKGFHKMEFLPGRKPSVEFVQLDRARKFFYYELTNENVEMMREQIDATLSDIAAIRHPKRPVVKFKILGSDTRPVDHDLAMLQRKYSDKIILSFVKQLESEDMAEKLEMVRGLRDERLSVEEVGLDMLRKSMEAMGFKPGFSPEDMFAMLSRGDTEKALAVLTDDHKALYELSRR